jgi:protein gp37
MADDSRIEWTDATWNIVTGCSVISPGCTNCYAQRLAGTRLQHHPSRVGLTTGSRSGPVWNGQVRFNQQWVHQPLEWKRPRKIFVCAHGDLFHPAVPNSWIDRVFAVMALAPHHTFTVLTKRADRMNAYMLPRTRRSAWQENAEALAHAQIEPLPYPLPNVWLGVSVEDQARAGDRIPYLLDTPAAVRWVSAEPLLGPVDFRRYIGHIITAVDSRDTELLVPPVRLDWIIVGGESGPGWRNMAAEWARVIRDHCSDAGVAFFMKQMAGRRAVPDDLLIRQWPGQSHGSL